jgi:hypothetical protein
MGNAVLKSERGEARGERRKVRDDELRVSSLWLLSPNSSSLLCFVRQK